MKKKLTNNIGLKLVSFVLAVVLWLVVVSIDDPVISRTYSGISVEILNEDAITKQGKTYEILDGSDTVSVVVSAKRSVLEKMSRDYIRATADMKELSAMNSVAIDVKSTRYADMITTITPTTRNLKVEVENLEKKQLSIEVAIEGSPDKGYVVGDISPSVNVMSISGPASLVSKISRAVASVDVTGMSSKISDTSSVILYDGNGEAVDDKMLHVGVTEIHVDVDILETKEIPVFASVSGTAAEGYAATGVVTVEPESIIVAGNNNAYSELASISIPAKDISIDEASDTIIYTLNTRKYLPSGVKLINSDTNGTIVVTVYVGKLENMQIDIPTANVSIENIPEGYSAQVVDIGGVKRVEVQGLNESLANIDPASILGTIDASSMKSREEIKEGDALPNGSYDGIVRWNLPTGIYAVGSSEMEVSMYRTIGENGMLLTPEQILNSTINTGSENSNTENSNEENVEETQNKETSEGE